MLMNSKTLLACVMVLFVLVSGTIYYTHMTNGEDMHYTIEKGTVTARDVDDTKDATKKDSSNEPFEVQDRSNGQEMLVVYLYGSIAEEGVYRLPVGSRVYEAVELAGGMTDEAASGAVNLARLLADGESIRFPDEDEYVEATLTALEETDDGLVDINTATVDELIGLPGVGESKARSVIAYRSMHGAFEKIEDIMKVSGIKEALFYSIRDLIKI